MTAQELKNRYRKILGEIKYINKRIEHEQQKEYDMVSIKVTGSSSEFPYLPTSVTVEAEEPQKASKCKDKIIRWQKDMERLYSEQRELEEEIDQIIDIELRDIVWRYCISGQTQKAIGEELCLSQSLINKKIKQFNLKNS